MQRLLRNYCENTQVLREAITEDDDDDDDDDDELERNRIA